MTVKVQNISFWCWSDRVYAAGEHEVSSDEDSDFLRCLASSCASKNHESVQLIGDAPPGFFDHVESDEVSLEREPELLANLDDEGRRQLEEWNAETVRRVEALRDAVARGAPDPELAAMEILGWEKGKDWSIAGSRSSIPDGEE